MNKNNKTTILQAMVLTGIMILSACAVLPSALGQSSHVQQVGHDVLNRLYANQDVMAWVWEVHPGDSIQGSREHVYDVTSSGYAVYIDIMPTANLFHPVKYVFYSETGAITTFDANSPPANFGDYTMVQTPFAIHMTSLQNIIPAHRAPSKAARDNRYAILMNGGYDEYNNHIRYWNDLSNICITLQDVYGFAQENIIVFCSDGTNPAPDQDNGQSSPLDLDGDGLPEIQYPCTLEYIDPVWTNLAANFSGGEKLFIFTTDHGSQGTGGMQTDENLWGPTEVLHDYHFAQLLAQFPEGTEIEFTLEPCFSGGFIDDAVVPPGPVVGSTAANAYEYSWAMPPDYVYDTYVFHWTAAMKGEDAYGVPVDADANGDGKVDFVEAYQYALAHDMDQEHPQYDDYPDGCGAMYSLWVSNAPPENVSIPAGPGEGVCGRPCSFTTSATEPDNEQVYYRFDWGDGNKSDWIGPYTPGTVGTCSYTWMNEGVFHVRAKAKDDAGSESSWTLPHNISIHRLPVLSIIAMASTIGKLTVTVKNIGTINVTDLNWSVNLKGGLMLLGKSTSGTNGAVKVGAGIDLQSKFILGFGKPTVAIRLETMGEVFERNATATILGPIIINLKFL